MMRLITLTSEQDSFESQSTLTCHIKTNRYFHFFVTFFFKDIC